MKEEINKSEAELNEQALEDVSGGGRDNPGQMVEIVCGRCRRRQVCSHYIVDLTAYLYEHRDVRISSYMYCPYYNEAE